MKNLAKLAQLNVRVPDELYVQMRIEAIRQRVSLQSLVSTLLSWGSREIEEKTKTGQLLLNELDGEDAASQKPVAVDTPDRVAADLGNSVAVLLTHYRELVRREDAEEFWRLRPPMPQSA